MKINYLNLEGITIEELKEIKKKINEIVDRINSIENSLRNRKKIFPNKK